MPGDALRVELPLGSSLSGLLAALRKWRFRLKVKLITISFTIVVAGFGLIIYLLGTEPVCTNLLNGANVSTANAASSMGPKEVSIPKLSDWVDYGPVLEGGPEGSWDYLWGGITPASVVKKNGTYYFYYVGSDGYRSFDGEGDRHRAIGVATSQDGIRFIKYSGNPIMTHAPFNGEEEGANSAGITLSTDGDFVMYYGAAIGPKDQINADGRVAVSKDGVKFTDLMRVLDHRSPSVPAFLRRPLHLLERRFPRGHSVISSIFYGPALHGHGDEIFPVATFQHGRHWYVYYVPNGGTAPRTLGMAWGKSFDTLPCSVKVLDGTWQRPVGIWGNVIWLAPDKVALFVQRLWWPHTYVEVRTASPHAPHVLSEPVERYEIPNLKRGTVFLDTDRRTWFMYYNTFDRFWNVKLAPAGDRDSTPPTAPANLSGKAASHDEVHLSWEAANDPDTGVVKYNVYRNGARVGSTKELTYADTGLSELTAYNYKVTAVNFHGIEGAAGETAFTTRGDTIPPTIVKVTSSGNSRQIRVLFSEAVEVKSAQNIANYSINSGGKINRISLNSDFRVATLTTSRHKENRTYTLTVNNVLDRAALPNAIRNQRAIYTYSPIPGLAGYWKFSSRRGEVAPDLSGHGNNATIHGETRPVGLDKAALQFDGIKTYVLVNPRNPLQNLASRSFTFAAWVKPEEVPSNTQGYGVLLRAGGHPASIFGLSYLRDKNFQARLMTRSSAVPVTLASGQLEPGSWHHVAMVVDDTVKRLHLYVNGKPVNGSPQRYTGTLLDLNENTGTHHIAGEYYIGSTKPDRGAGSFFNRYFKGLIDEARIYSRALSPAEVQSLWYASESRL